MSKHTIKAKNQLKSSKSVGGGNGGNTNDDNIETKEEGKKKKITGNTNINSLEKFKSK